MKKIEYEYLVTFKCPITLELEDDEDPQEVIEGYYASDIIQEIADTWNGDLSYADVDLVSICDEKGNIDYV